MPELRRWRGPLSRGGDVAGAGLHRPSHEVTDFLMNALIARGRRVLAQCDYAEDLPGGGEVAGATATP